MGNLIPKAEDAVQSILTWTVQEGDQIQGGEVVKLADVAGAGVAERFVVTGLCRDRDDGLYWGSCWRFWTQ